MDFHSYHNSWAITLFRQTGQSNGHTIIGPSVHGCIPCHPFQRVDECMDCKVKLLPTSAATYMGFPWGIYVPRLAAPRLLLPFSYNIQNYVFKWAATGSAGLGRCHVGFTLLFPFGCNLWCGLFSSMQCNGMEQRALILIPHTHSYSCLIVI